MNVFGKNLKAAIFDLDGTLIDSCNIWKEIDKTFFHMHNLEVPKNYSKEVSHIGLKEAAILTKEKYHIQDSVENILKQWDEMSKEQYLYHIQLKPHALEFLIKLKNNNIKLAIATANKKSLYEPCLKRLKIYDFFDFIADVDVVHEGKNSVKLYDFVTKKLNVSKEETAIFEDISIGLQTAFENGYIAIAVYDKNSENEDILKRQYSHIYVKNFNELL